MTEENNEEQKEAKPSIFSRFKTGVKQKYETFKQERAEESAYAKETRTQKKQAYRESLRREEVKAAKKKAKALVKSKHKAILSPTKWKQSTHPFGGNISTSGGISPAYGLSGGGQQKFQRKVNPMLDISKATGLGGSMRRPKKQRVISSDIGRMI